MSIESRVILKGYFQIGNTPTEQQFANLIDSYPNFSDDGITVYKVPSSDEDLFGIGVAQPVSRLGIKAYGSTEGVLDFYNSLTPPVRKWTIDLLPGDPANPGLGIEQPTAMGDVNRFFIQGTTGFIGIGTLTPEQKLHVQESTPNDITGIKVQNMAAAVNFGWRLGHLQDTDERDGAFSILEQSDIDTNERMVILNGGNVGINIGTPDVKLHVSRPLADPFSALDLIEGTGIAVLGPMTDNVVFDYRGLQARHGEFVGDILNITATTLNLQRLGGDILIHGDTTFAETVQGIITGAGWLGLGTVEPIERIEIDGAIKIGTTDNTIDNDGTIRFNGTDFEGRIGGEWVSLTAAAGSGPWTIGFNGIYYNDGAAPRATVGDIKTDHTFSAINRETVNEGSISTLITNKSTNSGSGGPGDHRIGAQIESIDPWDGDPMSKVVALYVKSANGQASGKERNIAAVLNGNVVVGNLITGSDIIGSGGENVLALQRSVSPPTTVPTIPAIQIYYGANSLGANALNILNVDGNTISLYQESILIPLADATAFPDAYDATVVAILDNMRDRINNLEAKLQAFGLLA